MAGPLSSYSISGLPISGSDGVGADICQIGALGGFTLGGQAISGDCFFVPVPPQPACDTGALGSFAFGGISISGDRCITPGPPTPPSIVELGGHGKRWRPIQDRTTRKLKDDNEIALWLAHFISSID